MRVFRAKFYDGVHAVSREASLGFDEETRTVELYSEGLETRRIPWDELRIEPPLGKTPRRVCLDATSHAEVEDSPDFREIEKMIVPRDWRRWVSFAEAHRGLIFGCVVGLVLVGIFMAKVALPTMARSVASKLPQETLDSISAHTLETMDRLVFKPSKLSPSRQEKLRVGFAKVAGQVPDVPGYRIEFRSDFGSPNAFALPSGTIVVTDELVRLAKSDKEVFAVLGHELGHVHYRHGMRLFLQQTGILLIVSFFLGDISGSLSSFGALPIALIENGYSREFEQEADDYGVTFCLRSGMGTKPMLAIFSRLQKKAIAEMPEWLSSHPNLSNRIERIRQSDAKEVSPSTR